MEPVEELLGYCEVNLPRRVAPIHGGEGGQRREPTLNLLVEADEEEDTLTERVILALMSKFLQT